MTLAEKVLRKIIIFVVVAAIAVPFITPEIFAASKVSVTGGDNVKAGDTFTLTVAYTGGGEVGRVDGQLEYDTDSLSYISGGTSTGDTGYVQLKEAGIDGVITFNLKFKALESGSTDVRVSTNDMYDLDERAMDTPSTSKSMTIGGGSADGDDSDSDKQTETTADSETIAAGPNSADANAEEADDAANVMPMLIIMAAILIVLIVIISIVLKKKRR